MKKWIQNICLKIDKGFQAARRFFVNLLKKKLWLKALDVRFRKRFWEIRFLRNWALLVLAAVTVNLVFDYTWIQDFVEKIYSLEGSLFPAENINGRFFGLLLLILVFCFGAVLAFALSRKLARTKGIRFFILSVLGLLVAKFWKEVAQAISFSVKSIYRALLPADKQSVIITDGSERINGIERINEIEKINEIAQIIRDSFTFSNIIQISGIILLGTFLYLFFRWLSTSTGIRILPFEESFIDDSSEEKKENSQDLGKAIPDLLAAELHRIYCIHALQDGENSKVFEVDSSLLSICRENLDLRLVNGEDLSKDLLSATTIKAKDAEIGLGSLLLAIRELWPWGSVQTIRGSVVVRQKGTTITDITLAARYEKKELNPTVYAYSIPEYLQEDENGKSGKFDRYKLTSLVRDLAYKIAVDSSLEPLSTTNWEAFKYLTEALSSFYDYLRTKSLDNLKKSFDNCKLAHKQDMSNEKIATLLSLISFSYLNRDEYNWAGEALNKANNISPSNPYVQASIGAYFYAFGQFELALKHYEYAKELKPDRHGTYIRTGMIQTKIAYERGEDKSKKLEDAHDDFNTSLILSPNNVAANSALAWLNFLRHEEISSKKITRSIPLTKDVPKWLLPIISKIPFWKSEYKRKRVEYEGNKYLLDAYERLKAIPDGVKTYADYSNLALVLLADLEICLSKREKGINFPKRVKEIHDNWWKALQIIQRHQLEPRTVYSYLLEMFFKLLTSVENKSPQEASEIVETNHFEELIRVHGILVNTLSQYLVDELTSDLARVYVLYKTSPQEKLEENLKKVLYENRLLHYLKKDLMAVVGSNLLIELDKKIIEVYSASSFGELAQDLTKALYLYKLYNLHKFILFEIENHIEDLLKVLTTSPPELLAMNLRKVRYKDTLPLEELAKYWKELNPYRYQRLYKAKTILEGIPIAISKKISEQEKSDSPEKKVRDSLTFPETSISRSHYPGRGAITGLSEDSGLIQQKCSKILECINSHQIAEEDIKRIEAWKNSMSYFSKMLKDIPYLFL